MNPVYAMIAEKPPKQLIRAFITPEMFDKLCEIYTVLQILSENNDASTRTILVASFNNLAIAEAVSSFFDKMPLNSRYFLTVSNTFIFTSEKDIFCTLKLIKITWGKCHLCMD